ncbi:MAG TPA: molybdopterin guanine dinucleotide-containing S/N-oxide reductase, partial [Burkholderiaceae bacterium]|nr:molybdopterin guanine dinucleotide-containing S/N-oxide reductase [Burkholderiaceae bacterium]
GARSRRRARARASRRGSPAAARAARARRRRASSSHWGAYEALRGSGDRLALRALADDPDPSPIGPTMPDAYAHGPRVLRPAIRAGWLERGPGGASERRGLEPFVQVSWEQAIAHVAAELQRVIARHGNPAIFGGSYGWASAGRFHHAQSQVHRFLNVLGGYVRHVDSYSLGAGRALMPHVVAPMDRLMTEHHDWDVLARHTRLFVAFGGVPTKNAQIGQGGASRHRAAQGLAAMARAGCRFVNFSPVRGELDAGAGAHVEWIAIRPNTDAAAMLAIACELIRADRHDAQFLQRWCTGFDRWRAYLLGQADGTVRDAEWAAPITGVPAERLRRLAIEMAQTRSIVNVAWALQRADHGEQAFWAAVGLACALGQVGLPGGGFAVGYGATNLMGSNGRHLRAAALPQLDNAVREFIPVARIADMLLSPGAPYDYNGARHRYPDIRLVYWAGGNPFHHHQDLNRFARAWRRPETVIVHEQMWTASAKMADIVLPATTTLERDDIGYTTRDPLMIAMKRLVASPGEARDDYAIFSAIAARLGRSDEFTEGRDARGWLRALYERSAQSFASAGVELPEFDAFWEAGGLELPPNPEPVVMLADFRRDPQAFPLDTPSGRIELFSQRIASFGYDDCPGHPAWLEPVEWLGSPRSERYPLHLISDQPHTKLHSQLDFAPTSAANKIGGREPVMISAEDARARGIADGDAVRVFNDRGQCLAAARVSDAIRAGVVKLSTGAWWDPESLSEPAPGEPGALDRHGNPNVLTRDAGASRLSQGCAAQSCLVQIERWRGPLPAVRAYEPPAFVEPAAAPAVTAVFGGGTAAAPR